MLKKYIVSVFLLSIISMNCGAAGSPDGYRAADLHNDILINLMQDKKYLEKNKPGQAMSFDTIKAGNYSLLTFAVWLPDYFLNKEGKKFAWMYGEGWKALEEYRFQNRNALRYCINTIKESFADSRFIIINGKKDLDTAENDTKTGILLAVEGLNLVNNIGDVVWLYMNGIRVFGLTWNQDNIFAHCHKSKSGLTEEGKTLVRNITGWGGVIDVSHSSEQIIYDLIEITGGKYPVVASHTGAKGICTDSRNLSDKAIEAIAGTGGVIGVGFYREFFKKKKGENDEIRASIKDVLDTVDYIAKLTSVDNVALGSDYGFILVPSGLENAGCVKKLAAELLDRGYSPESVKKIMGGNAFRVLRKILN
jgi:membrane dipeptidase